MRIRPARLALGAVGLALGVLGVLALREATLSTHDRTDPGSRSIVVVHAKTKGAERGQTPAEMVEALLLGCRLEVTADLDGHVLDEGDGRFRAVLQPALDQTDRRQFRGCLEDWTFDHLRVDVLELEQLASGEPVAGEASRAP